MQYSKDITYEQFITIVKQSIMYKLNKKYRTTIQQNDTTQGEPIERKVERMVENKEPIKDSAPLNYTERGEGVRPEHNIRTDRFELAIDATDKKNKLTIAAREERAKKKEEKKQPDGNKESPNSGTAGNETTNT